MYTYLPTCLFLFFLLELFPRPLRPSVAPLSFARPLFSPPFSFSFAAPHPFQLQRARKVSAGSSLISRDIFPRHERASARLGLAVKNDPGKFFSRMYRVLPAGRSLILSPSISLPFACARVIVAGRNRRRRTRRATSLNISGRR